MKPRTQSLIFLAAVIAATVIVLFRMPQDVDLLVVNARIHTMDPAGSVAEAMALRGDRIAGVGSRAAIERSFRAQRIIDLHGATVLPGFIDAHGHFLSLGLARLTVDLVGAESEGSAAARVADRVRSVERGRWIRGRGWDQNDWPSRSFPSRASLDRVAPDNPVYLARVDGHAAWLNSAAMRLAGITAATPDPPGGRILRDASGRPTGILVDAALDLALRVLPEPTDDELREALRVATAELVSKGITGIHDMGEDARTISWLRKLIDENQLPLRVYAVIDGPGEAWDQFLASGPLIGYGKNHLTVRAIKLYADGALGSRGAALIEPYSDDPGNRGLTMASAEVLDSVARQAVRHGFQVCTHAIGDRANHMMLDIYEDVERASGPGDRRLRIEHAQILDPEDIPRFQALHVIPSMQPTHCTSDMYWAEARLGPKRIRGAYAWRSLLATGSIIAGGSDFPIERPDPLAGIYAAVTRRDTAGHPVDVNDVREHFQLAADSRPDSADFADGWYGSQKMTRMEAVRCFTTWAATAAFEEQLKGSLQSGMLADFVVLSDDPFAVAAEKIPSIRVEQTYCGGALVFDRHAAAAAP